ncbi:MAG: cob(I)yrinic acid a,c-diamide adenosyltransferase [Bacillota bacterium]
MIHLYYGDGKGKTTAALGLALRAIGCSKRVLIVQFLKNSRTSELNALARMPEARVLRGTAGGFVHRMTQEEKERTCEIHNRNLKAAIDAAGEASAAIIVLDEGIDAFTLEMLDRDLFIGFLKSAPKDVEIVLTGHSLPDELIGLGDYITHMEKIKHPYDRGVMARKGIEY